MRYIVGVKEVHVSYREVEADSSKDAVVQAGDAAEFEFSYHSTLDPDTWTVEEKDKFGQ